MNYFDPAIHHRRSIRLKGYDYSWPGLYFVTLCVNNRECLFGIVKNGRMITNRYGEIIREEWFKSAKIRKEIILDEYNIMPNHFHGVIGIIAVGANGLPAMPRLR